MFVPSVRNTKKTKDLGHILLYRIWLTFFRQLKLYPRSILPFKWYLIFREVNQQCYFCWRCQLAPDLKKTRLISVLWINSTFREEVLFAHCPYMHQHSAEVALPGGSFKVFAPKFPTEKWKKNNNWKHVALGVFIQSVSSYKSCKVASNAWDVSLNPQQHGFLLCSSSTTAE